MSVMSIGFWQVIIIAVIVVLLFGRGKISELMGDVAKGIKSFKSGLAEDDTKEGKTIEHSDAAVVDGAEEKRRAS
jgi:sec-independent protein translocase protein TatA